MDRSDIIWIEDCPEVVVTDNVVHITEISGSVQLHMAMAVNTLLLLIQRARVAIAKWTDEGGRIDE